MKQLLILFLSLISVFASSQVSQKGMYHIKGKISDKYDNEYVKLFHL